MTDRNILFKVIIISLFSATLFPLSAQMIIGSDTLYGNEWIDYDQPYYKIRVGEDGLYRITYQALEAAGIFASPDSPSGADFQLFHMGKEIPLYASTNDIFSGGDFIEFIGRKNRGELDTYLYPSSQDQVNPRYSLFSDTSAYFLTWKSNGSGNFRYEIHPNDLSNLPDKEILCYYKRELEYHNRLENGKTYGSDGSAISGQYDLAEGYTRNTFSNDQTYNLNLTALSAVDTLAYLDMRFHLRDGNHILSVNVNDSPFVADTFSGWSVKNYQQTIPRNILTNTTRVHIAGLDPTIDRFRVSYVTMSYPHTFNFENSRFFEFHINGSAERQYLEISNFNTGGEAPVLFDLSNNIRISTTVENGIIKVVLPPSVVERHLILASISSPAIIDQLERRNWKDFSQLEGKYIILSHSALFDDGNGHNYVQEYADYRASQVGGGYSVIVADILDIYDEFGYGIKRHEQAVRNFVHYSRKYWDSEYLMIIGKGVSYSLIRDNSAEWLPYDFVPSFGYPNSDHLLAAGNDSSIPELAVGRIAAVSPEDIRIYLKKVKEYEEQAVTSGQTIEEKAWMKRVLHLGGGDPTIQAFIRKDLNQLKDSLSVSMFGADVVSFFKYSADVIQSAQTDEVIKVINEGTSMMSFFGHAAPTTLDFDLGSPRDYNNKGKYPVFYVIGCNTNRIFEKVLSLSEDYVFIEDRGAIGVFGATWQTNLSNLSAYGKVLYQNLGQDHYGETIGKILKASIEDIGPTPSFYMEQAQQVLIFHGDPALKIYPHVAPDYLVNTSKSAIEPALVSAESDSFLLRLVVTNIGLGIEDSIAIDIDQQLPDGKTVDLKRVKIPAPYFEVEQMVRLPLADQDALGLNKLLITVDAGNEVAEAPGAAEMNNTSQLNFAIISNDVLPVYPPDLSIVNESNPVLKGSTASAFSEELEYVIQIDTTETFDSPLFRSTQIRQQGGIVRWTPNVSFTDGTVYYWRISIDSTFTNHNGFNWRTSSFVYLPNSSRGWNQSHYQQIQKDSTIGLVADNNLAFNARNVFYKVKNAVTPTVLFDYEISVFRDGDQFHGEYLCVPYDLVALVFEPQTLKIRGNNNLAGNEGDYGSINCHGAPVANAFAFETGTPEGREVAINFLENVVNPDEFVILYTIRRSNIHYEPEKWAIDSLDLGTNLFQVLEAQGATRIRETIGKPHPYIFCYQKDNPGFTGGGEYLLEDLTSILEGNFVFPQQSSEGVLITPQIGPAKSWGALQWELEGIEQEDHYNIDLYGIDASGNDSLLYQGILAFDTILTDIDPLEFPYLRLEMNITDSVDYSAPQLHHLRVLYEPYPELALAPDKKFSFYKDTLQQGDRLRLDLALENIGIGDMDSLLVKFTIKDQNNQETEVLKRFAPINQGDSLDISFESETRHLQGDNILVVDANPEEDQLEQFHFNNIGVLEFHVVKDQRNPLLDVTFDGEHILDGDIVSPTPEIFVQVKDENEFLLLEDTSLFELLILSPGETDYRSIALSDPAITFTPASAGNNKASLLYRPEFITDGIYKLRVQARDATGNQSGDSYYEVSFEVITKSSISNIVNYPNPFSTATRFVYTMTGSESPADFKIQIMTVSGRIVREITQTEFGVMKAGTHLSDFTWDGTDEFGDPLANGVYLYRAVAKKQNGEDFEKYETGTQQYFKNEFGKMVIIR